MNRNTLAKYFHSENISHNFFGLFVEIRMNQGAWTCT